MTKWNRSEFIAYLMFYAAKSDQVIPDEERAMINSKFEADTVSSIESEISGDNYYQRLEQIDTYVKAHDWSEEQIDKLLEDIQEIFASHGHSDRLEKTTFKYLENAL